MPVSHRLPTVTGQPNETTGSCERWRLAAVTPDRTVALTVCMTGMSCSVRALPLDKLTTCFEEPQGEQVDLKRDHPLRVMQ